VFADAARIIKAKYPNAEFHLVGPFDPNPNRVSEADVAGWVSEGILQHHGMVRDVASALRDKHVFVLPTWYREGVPHASLEALSTGRAMITTDSVGARETVTLTPAGETQRQQDADLREGLNGYLVRPQSVDAVVQAMERYLQNPQLIAQHGAESRLLAEEIFDVRKVNALILREMGLIGTMQPLTTASTSTSPLTACPAS
jgi:glycosyltransferase involved in cell wall biosynthesis